MCKKCFECSVKVEKCYKRTGRFTIVLWVQHLQEEPLSSSTELQVKTQALTAAKTLFEKSERHWLDIVGFIFTASR